MKAGWEVKALGDVTQKLETVDPRKQPLEPFTYIDVSSVSKKTLAVSEVTKLLGNAAPSRARRMVRTGDTIFATIRPTLKRIAHIGAEHDQAVCRTGYMVLRPISKLEPRFVYYYLQSANFSEAMEGLQKGTSYPAVTDAEVRAQPIPLPPLEEQKRIVSILDEAFEGLDRARENAEANLKSARELFESVLLSVFGKMSEKNDLFLLKEVSKDFARGKSKHRPRNDKSLYGGDYPFIQTGDVRNAGHRVTAFTATYNEKGLAQSKLWPSGTVCITIAANIAETSILSFDACFPDSVIGMVPDETKTSSDYVEYVLQFFQKRLKAAGEGAAQDNINLKTFESEYFPFPTLTKQASAISKLNIASEIQQRVQRNYRTKLQDISDLRQSLLQKAFAGELT